MPDTTPKPFRSHRVFTAALWEDDWQEQESLFCDACEFASGTEFSHAEFRWTFGRVQGFSQAGFFSRVLKDLNGQLVKVEIAQQDEENPKRWYGVFVADVREYGGESPLPGQPLFGKQQLRAIGLEYFLHRWPLDSSFCMIKSGSDPADEVEIERALPFNPAGGYRESRRLKGNMDPEGEKGPVFVESMEVDAFEWSGKDILDYLVGYHMPKDVDGEAKIPFTRAADGGILGAFQGTLDGLDGRNIRDVLNLLMDRRRLLSWRLRVNFDGEGVETEVEIVPFNFNPSDLDLPGGTTIEANPDRVEIDVSEDPRVLGLEVKHDGLLRFGRVIARGERVVVCGSIDANPFSTGQFDRDWTDDLKTEYETGESGSVTDALDLNQKFRARDKFGSMWRRYKFKVETLQTWLGTEKVNEKDLRVYPPMARFLSILPLRDDIDYTTPSPSLHDTAPPGDSRDEYLPALAFIKDPADDRYMYLDNISSGKLLTAPEGEGRQWSASVQMRHETLGFVLNVSGGEQHVLGRNDFAPTDALDIRRWEDVVKKTAVDWRELVLTVALETDNWAEAQWPDAPEDEGDVQLDVIVVFPGKRLEYVLSGTAFDLKEDGSLKKAGTGGWIVDDREELKDLARLTYEWFHQTRKSLTLTVRSLDCPYEVGQLVTKIKRPGGIDLEEINSVITHIAFDLLEGTHTIRTQFGELDLAALVPAI